ncbi:family 4 glycosyl hydrolase [Acinetobacter nosocomialis]|uniref:family 4 glycosyl hydrolase n=1 Tax=Acinetobacter nosocomialis TaxID=106654 RepID=UPI001F2B9701|nr:hypothetical protein [Acinetobacter nosocomialis]MCE7531659.1 hypothetical protein [Acinetobacter nosocomialis]
MKITILGGSSPFIIDFFLNFNKEFYTYDKVITFKLFGRNKKSLNLIKSYLEKIFLDNKYCVEIYTDLIESIIDTDIIVNQIRFGGLDGRKDDELFAKKINTIPDETLGPCGLKAALRLNSYLINLSTIVNKYSTHKFFINMINPLSISTSLLTKNGIKNCIGVCELPKVTIKQFLELTNLSDENVKYDYYGLNHRGFFFNLRIEDELISLKKIINVKEKYFNGISVDEIIELNAIPLKYWKVLNGKPVSYIGRSDFLSELGNKIFQALEYENDKVEVLLSERSMPWYKEALIPIIKTIVYRDSNTHILNIHNNKIGYTEEIEVDFFESNLKINKSKELPSNLEKIIENFSNHEINILRAIDEKNLDNVYLAINSDPMLQKVDSREKYYIANLILNTNI